jgi:hypothetical protein
MEVAYKKGANYGTIGDPEFQANSLSAQFAARGINPIE